MDPNFKIIQSLWTDLQEVSHKKEPLPSDAAIQGIYLKKAADGLHFTKNEKTNFVEGAKVLKSAFQQLKKVEGGEFEKGQLDTVKTVYNAMVDKWVQQS